MVGACALHYVVQALHACKQYWSNNTLQVLLQLATDDAVTAPHCIQPVLSIVTGPAGAGQGAAHRAHHLGAPQAAHPAQQVCNS